MSGTDCQSGRWLQIGVCVLGALAIAACGPPRAPEGADVASVQLALAQVPGGVNCIAVTSTPAGQPATEQRFPVNAGQSSLFTISALPPGLVAFEAKAYGVACQNVSATTPVLWFGGPVTVQLGAGQTVSVTLMLRRAPGVNVGVDFCTSQPCGTVTMLAVNGATVHDLALGNGRVFFTDYGGILSVPVDGGDVAPLALDAQAFIRDGVAFDGSFIYTFRQASDGLDELVMTAMSNGAETILLRSTTKHGMLQVAANALYFSFAGGTHLETVEPAVGAFSRAVAHEGPLQTVPPELPQLRPYVVDDVTIYYAVPGFIRIGTSTGLEGGVLYTAPADEIVTALATDGRYLYFGTRGPGVSLKRIPVGGGKAETLAIDTTFGVDTFAIMRIVIDAVAVYWTTTLVPPKGTCSGLGLSMRPQAGGSTTPIPLFATTTDCGLDLVADASNLYLTAGRQVIRVAK